MCLKYLKFIRTIQRSSNFERQIKEVLRETKEVDNYNYCYQ